MSCAELRDRLLAGEDGTAAFTAHRAHCAPCDRFAARLEAVRGALRAPRATPPPDHAFSRHVLARLPRNAELLGWAAFRVLPAALALALTLAWMSSSEPPSVDSLLSAEPSTDLVLSAGMLSAEDAR